MYEAVQKDGQLPRGRHNLSRQAVRENQRRRLLAGIAKALAENGFARLTVEHVIENAGVSRRTFYEHFESREECLLAAYDAASDELWRAGKGAVAVAGDWPDRVRAAVGAALDFLAADPDRAHLFTIEARVSGEAVASRQRADTKWAAALLRGGRALSQRAAGLPAATEAALVENVAALAGANVLSGVTALLPGLAPQLTEYLVAPYLGAEDAERRVAAGSQPATRRISSAAA